MSEKDCPYLSVVLPIYNEKDTISLLITDCIKVLKEKFEHFEIIAVDDCSLDGTKQVLEDLKLIHANILRVYSHPYNKGNGAAIKTGIKASKGEWICCMDADGQHKPQDIFEMMKYVDHYDLIVGARPFGTQKKHREFANQFYNNLASWVTSFKVEDLTSGFRLFRGSVVKRFVPLFPSGFSYPTTSTLVMLKTGHNVKYIPINIQPRQGGKSKIKLLNDGWRFILIILKIFMLFDPIRVFLFISLGFTALAVISFVDSSMTLGSLHIPNSSVLFFLVSVLVLSLGFISEQITSIQLTLLDKDK
jgi:glycosyltransferase involved in cell wall biosynthesis